MALKFLRTIWFLSVLVVMADLLYIYAGLPESVTIQNTDPVSISKEWLFYILLALIIGINLLVYLFKMLYREGENIRAWFHGLVITINLFFIVSMHALSVFNGHEIFDHSRVGIFIGASLGLVVLWAAAWPLYLVFQKFFVKQAV